MQKFLNKLARARKSIVAGATQLGAAIVIIAPSWSSGVKVGVGLVGTLIALALVYRVPNKG
jgi:hypothetical protein